ncbi:FHA domain-containing protein [Synechocystis sp. LKSZ1]|uniref:FHA domain-containing protein n=1 Tax=Synechocystis sp. LKSZ1 TaxID=3144951 RepID=UPI00336BB337
MSDYSAKLIISRTDNENEWTFELSKTMPGDQYVIGRYIADVKPDIGLPDIALEDYHTDPFISRTHCFLKKDRLGWNIQDTSSNGTYLVRNNERFRLSPENDYLLLHDDMVVIQGYCLRFEDPAKTRPISPSPVVEKCPWVFNVREETLYRVDAGRRTEEHLSSRLTIILKYMADKNIKYGRGQVCTYKELSQVLEKDYPASCNIDQLHVIAQRIRDILSNAEQNPKKDRQKWFTSKATIGYILKIDCE